MKTFFYSHPACQAHDPNPEHPECPERLTAIDAALEKAQLDFIYSIPAPKATKEDLLLAHTQNHIDAMFDSLPWQGLNFIDNDTAVCPESGDAALHAVGAVLASVKAVLNGDTKTTFCAIRPPGHHAHRNSGGGFCLFNNVASGAMAALERHGLNRVAILDFDVHHGDGTQDIVQNNPNIFFASTYQHPLYASTSETALATGIANNVVNIPFMVGTDGETIVETWKKKILPKVAGFQPQLIFVSAGFDGHHDDPIGGLAFTEADYAELMRSIRNIAEECCQGRIIVVLEGGYNLQALANSVMACLNVLGE